MPKKILIVSYTFPPSRGIGGRRWAKFAKYLTKLGYDINVLCCENIITDESVWIKDVEGLKITTLPFNFPYSVAHPNKSLIGKIKYRLNVQYLKLSDKGNYFDRTIFWEKQVQEKASEIINQTKIDCVIVTSGPFRLSLYVVKLKKKFPLVKFIADFRDLWTEDVEITSFSQLSPGRKEIEKCFEKETARLADKVITVADELNNYFSSLTIANKFVVIPNGYDPDDFKNVPILPELKDDKIRFVFTGTLYINLSYILKPFFEALAKLKLTENSIYKKIQLEFIGHFPDEYNELLASYDIKDVFLFTERLNLNEVYAKISNAHYCLLFLNDVYNFALSTKFCEYISQRKKIIVVSNKGSASEFITKNKMGYWVDPKNSYADFFKIISDTLKNKTHQWDSDFDVTQFSLPKLTKQLANVIEEELDQSVVSIKRNLLLTFDYELFLGKRSGSIQNCIIKPTNQLLGLFEKHKITKAIFFIDTTYINKLTTSNEQNCINDLATIKEQLLEIVKAGHYIFPHLHPHWKDAVYDSSLNQWRLERIDNYRLHALPVNEQEELFSFAVNFINDIKKRAEVTYEIDSYRAGGWCMQPFEVLKPLFDKFSIRNDFSVLRGFKNNNPNLFYDYTKAPLKDIYHFSSEVELENSSGQYTEISISKITLDDRTLIRNRIYNKLLAYKGVKNSGDGLSVLETNNSSVTDLGLSYKNNEMISVELLNKVKLGLYKRYLDENDFMHFISHPKMISRHNHNMLDAFLKYATVNFELNTDYKKMIN